MVAGGVPKKFCGEKFLGKRKLLIFAMAEKRRNAAAKSENRIQNYMKCTKGKRRITLFSPK